MCHVYQATQAIDRRAAKEKTQTKIQARAQAHGTWAEVARRNANPNGMIAHSRIPDTYQPAHNPADNVQYTQVRGTQTFRASRWNPAAMPYIYPHRPSKSPVKADSCTTPQEDEPMYKIIERIATPPQKKLTTEAVDVTTVQQEIDRSTSSSSSYPNWLTSES